MRLILSHRYRCATMRKNLNFSIQAYKKYIGKSVLFSKTLIKNEMGFSLSNKPERSENTPGCP